MATLPAKTRNGINEERLELEFYPVLKQQTIEKFGAERIEILKPTRQQERFVGFDQGFTLGSPSIGHDELLQQLGDELKSGLRASEVFYLGYFLQFKVVEQMKNRTNSCPKSFASPYFRVNLDTKAEPEEISQHSTLRRLCQIQGARVFYACPMVFDVNELKMTVSLDSLALVDVSDAPPIWTDNSKKHILFQTPPAEPWWSPEPVKGKRIHYRQLLNELELMGSASASRWISAAKNRIPALPHSMTLMRVVKNPGIRPLIPLAKSVNRRRSS